MNYGESGLSASDVALINGRNTDGTFGGNNWAWIIVLFLIFGWGRAGYGGFGGGESYTGISENYVLNSDFATLQRMLSDGFGGVEKGLDTIRNGLCDGFYTNAQLINGVNTNILTTANTTQSAISNLGFNIQDCCCQTQRAIDGVNYNLATNTCAITTNATMNTRDIIDNMNANYRALHDEIVANRIEDKNTQIQMLQTKLNNAELRASQENQTREIVNTIRPCPIPAYQSCNPWGCNCNNGCGCN